MRKRRRPEDSCLVFYPLLAAISLHALSTVMLAHALTLLNFTQL